MKKKVSITVCHQYDVPDKGSSAAALDTTQALLAAVGAGEVAMRLATFVSELNQLPGVKVNLAITVDI